jgi:hypothetical protein
MGASVFTSTAARALKETLEDIIDDKGDGYESGLVCRRWLKQRPMKDAWEEDMEMGGPGLASEKSEGAQIALGSIRQGTITRYQARTFGLMLSVTEEAIEDFKYDQVVAAARRLKRSMYKTVDIDATNMLARAFNSEYVGGDGQPLVSQSHTLPHGGTFSNQMAVAMSPSRIAVTTAVSQVRKYPGHDGITEGYEIEKIVCPTEQWAVWGGILGSPKAPEPGAFNEINVVHDLGLTVVPVKYWDSTTTQWICITDCDNGLNLRWRRKPKSRTWLENGQEIMNYSISARWARGWSEPRCVLGVDA